MYQVIARKYRPRTFSEVVNQEHVKQTITNAIAQERIGHGYIFSGLRGTGKTTLARILAKALNCEKGPTVEPCLACSSCTEIAAGNSMDLTEIDAASNRRIDDIRELRENVRYRPVRDRYKVFIIDEAHQITPDAFNALLKTLEEPPEWVVFILCTTEPQQFPATIVSRCQSFPFRTVELDHLVEHLKWLCGQEGVEAEEDALVAIALAGDGSIRDSLSTLDQAIASFGKKLQAAAVRDLLGAIPAEITDAITLALKENTPERMLEIVDQLHREGRHLQNFSGELVRYFRNLLVMKVSGEDTRLIAAGAGDRKRMASYLECFSQEDLTRYLQLSLDLYRDLQQAVQSRFRLEVGLLKLVHAGRLTPIEKVLAEWGGGSPGGSFPGAGGSAASGSAAGSGSPRQGATPDSASAPVESVEAMIAEPDIAAPEPTAGVAATTSSFPQAVTAEPTDTAAASPSAGSASDAPKDLQQSVVRAFRQNGDDFTADAVEHAEVKRVNGHVEIHPSPDDVAALQINLKAVEAAVRNIVGKNVRVTLGSLLSAQSAKPRPSARAENGESNGLADTPMSSGDDAEGTGTEVERRALADPEVREFQKTFGGRVRNVRDLRRYS